MLFAFSQNASLHRVVLTLGAPVPGRSHLFRLLFGQRQHQRLSLAGEQRLCAAAQVVQPANEVSGGRPAETLSAPGSEHYSGKFDWFRGSNGPGSAEAAEPVEAHEEAAGVQTHSALGLCCGSFLGRRVNTQ